MERALPGAKLAVAGLQAQYGVTTASPDQHPVAGGPPKPGVMDRVILVHVDGAITLAGEVRVAVCCGGVVSTCVCCGVACVAVACVAGARMR